MQHVVVPPGRSVNVGSTMGNDYDINVFYSAEDEGWIADIPALGDCTAFGDTPQEAVAEMLVERSRNPWIQPALRRPQRATIRAVVYRSVTPVPVIRLRQLPARSSPGQR
jgi:hypothetical protein